MTMPHPVRKPIVGPSALVLHVKAVPASGMARLRYAKEAATSSRGMNPSSRIAGDLRPAVETSMPAPARVAAAVYAGAGDAIPTVRVDQKPIAFFFSWGCAAPAARPSSVELCMTWTSFLDGDDVSDTSPLGHTIGTAVSADVRQRTGPRHHRCAMTPVSAVGDVGPRWTGLPAWSSFIPPAAAFL